MDHGQKMTLSETTRTMREQGMYSLEPVLVVRWGWDSAWRRSRWVISSASVNNNSIALSVVSTPYLLMLCSSTEDSTNVLEVFEAPSLNST